jgi:hypothetical protein
MWQGRCDLIKKNKIHASSKKKTRKKEFRHSPSRIGIGTYKFETVHSFTYVISEVN